jgi:hypothetical protein
MIPVQNGIKNRGFNARRPTRAKSHLINDCAGAQTMLVSANVVPKIVVLRRVPAEMRVAIGEEALGIRQATPTPERAEPAAMFSNKRFRNYSGIFLKIPVPPSDVFAVIVD